LDQALLLLEGPLVLADARVEPADPALGALRARSIISYKCRHGAPVIEAKAADRREKPDVLGR
jgi:hypothetical protein